MKSPRKLLPGERATYVANPFYDDIIILLENLPSAQDRLKPIDKERRIFELIEKNNVTAFKKSVGERLISKRKPNWPYMDELYVAVGIMGLKKDVVNKDLDNLLKTLFDTLKGIVFRDDNQIVKLSAEKTISDRLIGISIAIKRLNGRGDLLLAPYFYSGNENTWIREREDKEKQGLHTYFDAY